ncbi:MAG: hypothetical protein CMH52_00480 [Myxococcales bacterium]|nr:hypothetical protein [Myxococcales bacterium]
MLRWVIFGICFIILGLWGRTWWSSRAEFTRAVALERSGKIEKAIEHYQYAARWYSPLATTPISARSALQRIAIDAVKNNNVDIALKAYRRLRGAILSTRGITNPGHALLPSTNDAIAGLMAQQQLGLADASSAGRTEADLKAHHLRLLQLDPIPGFGWSMLIVLSFLGWVSAVVFTIRRGLSAELTVVKGPFLKGTLATIILLGLWVFALFRA